MGLILLFRIIINSWPGGGQTKSLYHGEIPELNKHIFVKKQQIKVTDSGRTCPLQGEMSSSSHGEFAFLAAVMGGSSQAGEVNTFLAPPSGTHIVPWNKQMWPRTAHFYPQFKNRGSSSCLNKEIQVAKPLQQVG